MIIIFVFAALAHACISNVEPASTQPAAPSLQSSSSATTMLSKPSGAVAQPLLSGSGSATKYDVLGAKGSCGFPIATNNDAVVAMSHLLMRNPPNPNLNPLCGQTLTILYQGQKHTATIYDTCESADCAWGNIDLALGFFEEVFPRGDGRVFDVDWSIG